MRHDYKMGLAFPTRFGSRSCIQRLLKKKLVNIVPDVASGFGKVKLQFQEYDMEYAAADHGL